MTTVSTVDFDVLAAEAKSGNVVSFEQLFVALYAERRRFIHSALLRFGEIDAEATFNDALQSCVKSYKPGNSFIGLLRLRLNGIAVATYRKEAARREREIKHVQQFTDITLNPLLFSSRAVEFTVFCSGLDTTLQDAVKLLLDGYTLNEVRVQLGYGDQRSLRNELRKQFSVFLES